MDDTKKVWEYFQQIDFLGEIFGVANIHNLAKKAKRVLEERNLYKSELEEFCAIAGLEGIRQRANAKARFRNLMSRNNSDAAKSYGLDASFLDKIGEKWDKSGVGESPEAMIKSWNKKVTDQRELVQEAYNYCLRHVEELAREANYSEDRILEVVRSYHDSMVEDFHELTVAEFWQAYRGNFVGAIVLPHDKEEQVPLANALGFVQEVAPATVYQNVVACGTVLSTISKTLFQKWEVRATEANQKIFKAGREELVNLMVDIIGIAVHRLTIDNAGLPDVTQRSALTAILAPVDLNPYGAEYCVDENTTLEQVMGYYLQNVGAQ